MTILQACVHGKYAMHTVRDTVFLHGLAQAAKPLCLAVILAELVSCYLAALGTNADPFLRPQEFGIDIVGEDNKTIIHHKVAARVVCVFTEQDAQAAAHAEQHQNPPLTSLSSQPNGSSSAFNFADAWW